MRSASSALHRGRETAETIETPRSPSTRRVFSRTSERALRPRRARRLNPSRRPLPPRRCTGGREIAETIKTPRSPSTRRVLSKKTRKALELRRARRLKRHSDGGGDEGGEGGWRF